jgi:hypothetical protein
LNGYSITDSSGSNLTISNSAYSDVTIVGTYYQLTIGYAGITISNIGGLGGSLTVQDDGYGSANLVWNGAVIMVQK